MKCVTLLLAYFCVFFGAIPVESFIINWLRPSASNSHIIYAVFGLVLVCFGLWPLLAKRRASAGGKTHETIGQTGHKDEGRAVRRVMSLAFWMALCVMMLWNIQYRCYPLNVLISHARPLSEDRLKELILQADKCTAFPETAKHNVILAELSSSIRFVGRASVKPREYFHEFGPQTELRFEFGEIKKLAISIRDGGPSTDHLRIYGPILGKGFGNYLSGITPEDKIAHPRENFQFEVECTKELSKAVQELFKEGPDTIAQVVPEKTER